MYTIMVNKDEYIRATTRADQTTVYYLPLTTSSTIPTVFSL